MQNEPARRIIQLSLSQVLLNSNFQRITKSSLNIFTDVIIKLLLSVSHTLKSIDKADIDSQLKVLTSFYFRKEMLRDKYARGGLFMQIDKIHSEIDSLFMQYTNEAEGDSVLHGTKILTPNFDIQSRGGVMIGGLGHEEEVMSDFGEFVNRFVAEKRNINLDVKYNATDSNEVLNKEKYFGYEHKDRKINSNEILIDLKGSEKEEEGEIKEGEGENLKEENIENMEKEKIFSFDYLKKFKGMTWWDSKITNNLVLKIYEKGGWMQNEDYLKILKFREENIKYNDCYECEFDGGIFDLLSIFGVDEVDKT